MREPIPREPTPPIRRKRGWNLVGGKAVNGSRNFRNLSAEPTRQYHRTRLTSLQNVLPNLLQRITDPAIPADELSPLEIAAREYRLSLFDDLGGYAKTTAVQRSLITTIVGSWIVMNTADRYLLELATATTKHGGLIDRRAKRFIPVVAERMKIAGGFVRQLQALGLEKQNALPGGINVERAVVLIPDNNRDQLPSGGTTNGSHPSHRSPESESPTEIATGELPPRDADDFISPNGDRHDDDNDDLERTSGSADAKPRLVLRPRQGA